MQSCDYASNMALKQILLIYKEYLAQLINEQIKRVRVNNLKSKNPIEGEFELVVHSPHE